MMGHGKRYSTLKLVIAAIIVCVLLAFGNTRATASELEGAVINEIVIVGNTRTDDSLILRQLPFKTGDNWKEEYSAIALKRLLALGIFDPINMRITTEPISLAGIRVVIRVSDPHVLYNDPIEFAVMHLQELVGGSFYQTLYNPFGIGLNLKAGGRWGNNPSAGLSLSQPLAGGWVMGGGLMWSDITASFYEQGLFTPAYSSNGILTQLSFNYYATETTTYGLMAGYRYGNTSINSAPESTQHYLLAGPGASWSNGLVSLAATIRTGLDLGKGRDHYFAFSGSASGDIIIGESVLTATAAGGFMTEKAPLNHQFIMGGFGTLPLRGHGAGFIGNAYLNGVTEYWVPLGKSPFWLIGFLDAGKMWYYSGEVMSSYDWAVDGGVGLAVSTPLGFAVRFDLARSLLDYRGWNWRIYLDIPF